MHNIDGLLEYLENINQEYGKQIFAAYLVSNICLPSYTDPMLSLVLSNGKLGFYFFRIKLSTL